MEHHYSLAQKEEAIKNQQDEFITEKNRFMKTTWETTNKEQDNTCTEKSRRRDAQQRHSDQTKRMKNRFRDIWKQPNDILNGMSNMVYGFLDEVV